MFANSNAAAQVPGSPGSVAPVRYNMPGPVTSCALTLRACLGGPAALFGIARTSTSAAPVEKVAEPSPTQNSYPYGYLVLEFVLLLSLRLLLLLLLLLLLRTDPTNKRLESPGAVD